MEEPEIWTPVYQVGIALQGGGERTEMVPIDKVQQPECPVSIIHRHAEMNTLLGEVTGAMSVQQTTGAMAFGMDSGKWPARWYDAVMLVNREDDRVETERDKVRTGR